MKKAILMTLIVALCLLVAGGTVFTIAMAKTGWDFSALSNVVYEEKTFEADADAVQKIAVKTNTDNISFAHSEDDKVHILYYNKADKKGRAIKTFEPTLADGVLTLAAVRSKKSFMNMDFGKDKTFLLSVPEGKKIDLEIEVSTGDVKIGGAGENFSFGTLSLSVSTGDISLAGTLDCDASAFLKASTGDIGIGGDLRVAEALTCRTSTGDIGFSAKTRAKKVECKASTGKISFSVDLQAESVSCETSTGDVTSSAAIMAESVKVVSDTGDVSLLLAGKKEDWSCLLSTDSGKTDPSSYIGGNKRAEVCVDTGDIHIRFSE